jgi:predicted alpha/beta superfamily hydrolase
MKILSRTKSDFFAHTEIWLVHSDIVGEVFRVCVSAPLNPLAEGQRVGAFYTTDAGLMAGAATSVSWACEMGGEIPPQFIVSVGYPFDSVPSDRIKRNRDLTPSPRPDFDPIIPKMMGSEHVMASGGGDAFLTFLVDELRPALAEAFPIDPDDATLGGASLGGLFTLHALLSRPGAFRRYLAICPSIWWDAKIALRRALAAERPATDIRLYMCAGEFESQAHGRAIWADMPAEMAEMAAMVPAEMSDADMHGDMFAMERALAAWGDRIAVRALVYPEESHGSLFAGAMSRGLRWLSGSLKR